MGGGWNIFIPYCLGESQNVFQFSKGGCGGQKCKCREICCPSVIPKIRFIFMVFRTVMLYVSGGGSNLYKSLGRTWWMLKNIALWGQRSIMAFPSLNDQSLFKELQT